MEEEGDVSGMGYGSSRDNRHKFCLLCSFIPHLVAMVTRISKADSRWSSPVVRSTRSSAYMSRRAESSDSSLSDAR